MHSGMTLEPFLFLCRLAYAARYRIPLIITVVFIALDIQMQVEINVEMRSVHRDADLPSTTDDDNQSEGVPASLKSPSK